MADEAQKKQRGRPFPKGVSGNPAGRPKGAKDHATRMVQALLDSRAKEVVEKALEVALGGDGPTLRAILDRLCPARRDAGVSFSLPQVATAGDLPKVTAALLDAVARGDLTPSEAQAVAGLVEMHRRALETSELEERIARLEDANEL